MQQVLGCSVSYRITVGWGHSRGARYSRCRRSRPGKTMIDFPRWRKYLALTYTPVSRHMPGNGRSWRLCRYISRPAVSEKRLSLTSSGNIRYDVKGITSVTGAGMPGVTQLKTPNSDGTTHVIFEPLGFMSHIRRRLSYKSAFLPNCHCQAGGAGAETESKPDPVPRRIRAQQQTPGRCDAG